MRSLYLLIPLLVLPALAVANDARKANEAYERGDYDEAVRLYREAIRSEPEDARLHFNLGNSLARAGQSEEAISAYEQFKTFTDDPHQQSLADYNIGNILSEHEQYQEAIDAYRNALRNNPDDEDAKHNYELALRQQQQQEEEHDEDPERPDHPESDREDDDEGGDQEQPSPQPGMNDDQQQDQQDGMADLEPQMSQEEAQSVLDALQQRERELLENRRKTTDEVEHEKDW